MSKPSKNTLAIYANASSERGFGHVMRQLALIEYAKKQNQPVLIYCHEIVTQIHARLHALGVEVIKLNSIGVDDIPALPILIIDDYQLKIADYQILRDKVDTLVLFDDAVYSDLPRLDMVINPSDVQLSQLHAKIKLQGVEYRLLREEFCVSYSRKKRTPHSVLICLGGSDVKMLSASLAQVLLNDDRVGQVHVLATDSMIEENLKALEALRSHSKCKLYINCQQVAPVMASVEVAISTAGSSLYELMAIGVPTLALIVADNQKQALLSELNNKAYLSVDIRHTINSELLILQKLFALIGNSTLKQQLSSHAISSIDGCAAKRIVSAINNLRSENMYA